MSGAFGDMGNLLKQAQKMQGEIDKMETELSEARIEGSAGGGAVQVVVSGDSMIQEIKISDEAFAGDDKELFEDLVLAALRDGLNRAKAMKKERMQRAMGGLNLPGLF